MANLNWFGFSLDAFLWVFIILNIANVIIQTVKSIATIKCGAWSASVINAVAYGLYTVVVVFMNADGLGILWKAVVIGLANLVGVYIVKRIEIKNRKDKLWKVEATIPNDRVVMVDSELVKIDIPHNWLPTSGNYSIFNIYCTTQEESHNVREVLNRHNAKYFVSESKTL